MKSPKNQLSLHTKKVPKKELRKTIDTFTRHQKKITLSVSLAMSTVFAGGLGFGGFKGYKAYTQYQAEQVRAILESPTKNHQVISKRRWLESVRQIKESTKDIMADHLYNTMTHALLASSIKESEKGVRRLHVVEEEKSRQIEGEPFFLFTDLSLQAENTDAMESEFFCVQYYPKYRSFFVNNSDKVSSSLKGIMLLREMFYQMSTPVSASPEVVKSERVESMIYEYSLMKKIYGQAYVDIVKEFSTLYTFELTGHTPMVFYKGLDDYEELLERIKEIAPEYKSMDEIKYIANNALIHSGYIAGKNQFPKTPKLHRLPVEAALTQITKY